VTFRSEKQLSADYSQRKAGSCACHSQIHTISSHQNRLLTCSVDPAGRRFALSSAIAASMAADAGLPIFGTALLDWDSTGTLGFSVGHHIHELDLVLFGQSDAGCLGFGELTE